MDKSLKNLKKLCEDTSHDERSIKKLLSQEYEALETYKTLAVEAEDERVKKVFLDIAGEEEIHAGELRELLKEIGFSDEETNIKGAKEVKGLVGRGNKNEE